MEIQLKTQLEKILSVSLLAGGLALLPALAGAQVGPPIRGTIALKGTVDKVYEGANKVAVATEDGVEHIVHLTGHTTVHGGELEGLEKGRIVVVHFVPTGGEETAEEIDQLGPNGLKTTEGTVTKVDRKAKTIAIRLQNGSVDTLRLTDRAAVDVGKDVDAGKPTKVVIYYEDGAGSRMAHFFEKVS
jgi:hypothetical protein